jgi:hypothetical protein
VMPLTSTYEFDSVFIAGVAHEIALFVNEKCHEKTKLRAAEAERDDLLRENYLYRLGMPVR